MSNIIVRALADLKFRIPVPILKEAFKDDTNSWRSTPISLDEQIMSKVIRPRVILDMDNAGGHEAYISLEGLTPVPTDPMTVVYHIPKDRTQNKSIMSVLNVGFVNYSMSFAGSSGIGTISPQSINDVMNVSNAVFNSHSSAPPISTANVSLISENTIMIRDMNRIVTNNYLLCILGNDEYLNNIPFRAIPKFCKLVELAVKCYIYNTMIIKMGETYLSGGQDLGVFKSIVESYSDSESMYIDYVEQVWSKVAFAADPLTFGRFIRSMVGSTK